MQIEIKDLEFHTIIGILDFERTTKQLVCVNCKIDYTYQEEYINYALVAEHIEDAMHHHKFELIEDALLSLKVSLKKAFPLIQILYLKISKPNILKNCEVALSETTEY